MVPAVNPQARPALRPADVGALRERVEALGTQLAEALSGVVTQLPGRPSGPSAVGAATGQTTVTASRLLKAISQHDPVAVLHGMPGPVPLRRFVEGARVAGVPAEACDACLGHVEAFEELIRSVSGDRSSFHAVLSSWLPGMRADFEAQRRQSLFKAFGELEGVHCNLELSTMIVAPSATEGALDLVNVQAMLGIERSRPDAPIKLGTHRLGDGPDDPRLPLTLEGEPAVDGLHSVRLDAFCDAPPAPFQAREYGDNVEYSLGSTGIGRSSKVDLVIAELNRAEMKVAPGATRYFYMVSEMATRKAVFDVFIHEDVFVGATPRLVAYQTGSLGAARVDDPARELDKRPVHEEIQQVPSGWRGARILEFPRYGELLDLVSRRLQWDLDRFRLLRLAVTYPVLHRQLVLAFDPPGGRAPAAPRP